MLRDPLAVTLFSQAVGAMQQATALLSAGQSLPSLGAQSGAASILQGLIGITTRYDDELQSDRALSVHVDPDGQTFIGTDGRGLVTFVSDGQGGGNRVRILDGTDVTAIVDDGVGTLLVVEPTMTCIALTTEATAPSISSSFAPLSMDRPVAQRRTTSPSHRAENAGRWPTCRSANSAFRVFAVNSERILPAAFRPHLAPRRTSVVYPTTSRSRLPTVAFGSLSIRIADNSGGLVAHEIVDPDNPIVAGLHREQYNWLNAPGGKAPGYGQRRRLAKWLHGCRDRRAERRLGRPELRAAW